jgi:hypothetical protein
MESIMDDIDKRKCQYCGHIFAQRCTLLRHLRKQQCKSYQRPRIVLRSNEKIKKLEKQLAEKDQEIAQLKNQPPHVETIERLEKMEKRLDEKDKQIEQSAKERAELKENPRINNQVLQVVCVGSNDNYLDMLTEELNNFDKASEYIKDCTLSSLIGDCKLIEKIYCNANHEIPSIRFLDKARTKVEYYNEKNEKVKDSKEIFGKKIANNLQNSLPF